MFLDVRDCLVKWLKQLQRKNQHSSLLRSEAIGAPKGYVEGPVWWIPEISKQPERAEALSTAGKKWGASGTARVSLPGCSLDCVGSVKLEVNNSCGKPWLGGNHPRYPTTNINHKNAADLAQHGTIWHLWRSSLWAKHTCSHYVTMQSLCVDMRKCREWHAIEQTTAIEGSLAPDKVIKRGSTNNTWNLRSIIFHFWPNWNMKARR